MITTRLSRDRGHFNHGWLDTYHTFSFGDYQDPRNMEFRSLRVINEDRVAPGQGFGTHPHRDMEIITYVVSGALEHRDSLGHGEVLRPGEVQRMTAGSGILHSEFNPSPTEPAHLLQIWIKPSQRGLPPGYEQKALPAGENRWRVLVSSDGADGSLKIHQDARLLAAKIAAGKKLTTPLSRGRHAWVQVVRGLIDLNGSKLGPGDGAAASDESSLTITAAEDAQVLLFDLA